MFQIRRLALGEERVLQEIRLRALLDEPDAFGSSYEREFVFVQSDWQRRLARIDAATFVCERDDGVAVGLVTGVIDDNSALIAWLTSMWVDPESRGSGVAGLLIDEVIAWSLIENCALIRLDFTEGNGRAERAYEKRGFRRTGTTSRRERDNMAEIEMERKLNS